MSTYVSLRVRVPSQAAADAAKKAQRDGKRLDDVVAEALERYVNPPKPKRPKVA